MILPHVTRDFFGGIATAMAIYNQNREIFTGRANINPGFVSAAAQHTGRPVTYLRSSEGKHVSMTVRWATEHLVVVPQCWTKSGRRFGLCKELCHVICDSESSTDPNPSLETARLISHANPRDRGLLGKPLDPELFAYVVALELMIPHDRREELIDPVSKGVKSDSIEEDLGVPYVLISQYFRDYYEMSNACRDLIILDDLLGGLDADT